MESIVITFPTGNAVQAKLMTDREPALTADLAKRLAAPQEMICNHAVSAGKIFDAYLRPAQEPTPVVIGQHPVSFSDLAAGDIVWDGEKLRVVYGECAQPGIAGCVVAKTEATAAFEKDCKYIWYDIYREHTVSAITVAREEVGK